MNTVFDVPAGLGSGLPGDETLELQIEQARVAMTEAQEAGARREAYEQMRWLIAQRSPEQIERMERAQGLRL